ncbi:MAG: hypothetical protein CHACPFDD_02133 [Phycisphaerae bacterium]|nr:hypothetical protein [Phycisphaerae bacterium]
MPRVNRKCFALCAVVFCFVGALRAQTIWYVDEDAPGDPGPGDTSVSDPAEDGSLAHPFDAIQEGITASVAGDVVLVRDGTYTGSGNRSISMTYKVITVKSENGPAQCTIDCQGSGVAFWFVAFEPPQTVVDGFTITGGNNSSGGAFFLHHDASPTVRNCIIRGNRGSSGGAIHGDVNAAPTFVNCTIEDNLGVYGGGALFAISPSREPKFINCVFRNNSATQLGGAVFASNGKPLFVNCVFSGNQAEEGGAIYASNSGIRIVNCTLSANQAADFGGALAAIGAAGAPAIRNSLVWGNAAATGPEIALLALQSPDDPSVTLTVEYSDVRGGEAGAYVASSATLIWSNSIDADPRFRNPATDDFALTSASPAIDAASNALLPPDFGDLDADGDAAEPTPLDFAGNRRRLDDPRRVDTGAGSAPLADMGAFEFVRLRVVGPLP